MDSHMEGGREGRGNGGNGPPGYCGEQSIHDCLADRVWINTCLERACLPFALLLLVDDRLAMAVNNCRVQESIVSAAVDAGSAV